MRKTLSFKGNKYPRGFGQHISQVPKKVNLSIHNEQLEFLRV